MFLQGRRKPPQDDLSLTEDGAPLGPSRVGAELRTARQRLGWDLADVAANLRIRLSHLESIEAGRIADLPGNAYAMGFIRTYAGALGLDPTEVARRFRAESQEVNRRTELSFPAPVPERGVPAMVVVLLGLLVAGGAYAVWYKFSGNGTARIETVQPVPDRLAPLVPQAERTAPPSSPSPQVASILPQPAPSTAPIPAPNSATPGSPPVAAQPAPQPVPAPVAPAPTPVLAPAAPPKPDARIVVRMKADGLIQVRERQGQVLLNRVMRSGETWPVPDRAQLLLTTGNAGSTELVVDGKPGPNLGQVGALRRDIPLDADALRAGRTGLPAPRPPAPAPRVSTPEADPQ